MFRIDKDTALNLLMQRLDFWLGGGYRPAVREQWQEYLADWLDRVDRYECDIRFDPLTIIDNMWVNDLEFIDKQYLNDDHLDKEVGEQISTADYCGTIDYVGEDFIVLDLR